MSNSDYPNDQSQAAGAIPVWIAKGGINVSSVFAGQQAVTTGAVALPNQVIKNSVAIIALSTNTGTIYVGPPGVTTATGYPLLAGQAIGYVCSNLDQIAIIAGSAVGSVAYTGS